MKSKLLFASVSLLSFIAIPIHAQTDMPTNSDQTTEAATDATPDQTTEATSETTDQATETTEQTTETVDSSTAAQANQPIPRYNPMPIRNARVVFPEARRMGHLIIKPAPIYCVMRESANILRQMNQNIGRAIGDPCRRDWLTRIALSGGINVDFGKIRNQNVNYMGENYQHASLNDAYLNLSAVANDWTTVFFSLSFNNATINDPTTSTVNSHVAEFDAAYSQNIKNGGTHTFQLEQGFITFANFEQSPVFVQIGKQFQDFGRYELHPITEPLTQVMSKTLETSFKIGFIYKQFSGSAWGFEDHIPKVNHTSKSMNYGGSINFAHQLTSCLIGLSTGLSYMYNLVDVNDITYNVNQFNLNNPVNLPGGGYNQHTSGVAAYLDIIAGPFTFNGRYTTAMQRFNVADLPKRGLADIDPTGKPFAYADGAKPWAAGAQIGYGFGAFGKPQFVFIGAQQSNQAAAIQLPRFRWLAGYSIDMVPNTKLGIEWDYDEDYKASSGGTNKNTTLVTLRAEVKFG